MDFISLIDLTTKPDEGHNRQVSLAMNETRGVPNTLRLLGGLSHNTVINMDRANATKMRDFCQKIIDVYDKR